MARAATNNMQGAGGKKDKLCAVEDGCLLSAGEADPLFIVTPDLIRGP
jgi:hypothetical protein